MRVLFIGESWQGSCARSLKEALRRQPGIRLDEINEDLYIQKPRTRLLRAANRLLMPFYRAEVLQHIMARVEDFRPDVIAVYKGRTITADWVRQLRSRGSLVVNIYPDCSPHAHGVAHKEAVGAYDLVISTKPFHPVLWRSVYGYRNPCVFVPQGYDPVLHLEQGPVGNAPFDVTMVATWRPEYGALMRRLGRALGHEKVTVAIAGNGWAAHRADYPSSWVYGGPRQGLAYLEWLRQGKIALAPVTREVVIDGQPQPGDEDTTRTYELAAAHTFFIHRRTDFVQRLYDEDSEVPMFDTPEELAQKIVHYRSAPQERVQMAAAAHRRAVPAYSLDARAAEIVSVLSDWLPNRKKRAP